jgi:hypothetical protein
MSLIGEQVLLRAYLQSADRAPMMSTSERIVAAARTGNLAGATVLRGIMGAGFHGIIRQSNWGIAQHVPVIVEIVDSAEKISAFVNGPLSEIMVNGMLTLERAAVMMYRRRAQSEPNRLQLAAALAPLSTVPLIQPGSHMSIKEDGVLLRAFIGESDKFEHKPLYEAIVLKARELGLAGATVLKGTEGFGANSLVHKDAVLAMSSDLPVLIEIVDSEEKINLLLPHLETMVREGMVTMEHVAIFIYRHNDGDKPSKI